MDFEPKTSMYVSFAEVDANHPLPPPKKAAVELQRLAKKSLKNWYDKFGQTYKKLALCYNYLLTSKQVSTVCIDI